MTLNTLGLSWVIAGGYAACPELAGDKDVWVFAGNLSLSDTRERIIAANPSIVSEGDDLDEKAYILETGFRTLKVGRLDDAHILVTEAVDVQMLLSGFDISTHQCAIDENGTFIKGGQWTPLTAPPVVLIQTTTTDERMAKITSRYQHLRAVAA